MEASTSQRINETATPLIEAYGKSTALKFQAKQLERNARALEAKGTRDAAEIRRQGKVLSSNARAAMAGAGGSASDAGAVEGLAKLKGATDYNALAALFESETKADEMTAKARAKTFQARQAEEAGAKKSLSTVLSNSDKIFGK